MAPGTIRSRYRQTAGLVDASEKLRGIKGIAMVELLREDIVRHRLVQNIVDAYEREKG